MQFEHVRRSRGGPYVIYARVLDLGVEEGGSCGAIWGGSEIDEMKRGEGGLMRD